MQLGIPKMGCSSVLKIGPFPAVFFFIRVFLIQLTVKKITDDWIRTAELWYRKRPFNQISHN